MTRADPFFVDRVDAFFPDVLRLYSCLTFLWISFPTTGARSVEKMREAWGVHSVQHLPTRSLFLRFVFFCSFFLLCVPRTCLSPWPTASVRPVKGEFKGSFLTYGHASSLGTLFAWRFKVTFPESIHSRGSSRLLCYVLPLVCMNSRAPNLNKRIECTAADGHFSRSQWRFTLVVSQHRGSEEGEANANS